MAQPEYKAGKIQLVRGVEIDDNLSISFWFNISDPDLKARLDAYYQATKDDFKQQPGLEIQVKIGDTFHRVASPAATSCCACPCLCTTAAAPTGTAAAYERA